MKYYSEITKQVYDSEAACYAAERKEKTKTDARKKEAEKVEAARKKLANVRLECEKKIAEARNEYETVLAEFCKKYGAYHTSIDFTNKEEWPDLKSIVNSLFF